MGQGSNAVGGEDQPAGSLSGCQQNSGQVTCECESYSIIEPGGWSPPKQPEVTSCCTTPEAGTDSNKKVAVV